MAEDFKIEVPISIKSGAEGKKVGKDIGDQIASQIKKIYSSLGRTTGGGAGLGDAAALSGVSKGLTGVATKLGIIGVAIGAAVGLLAKSSPMLKGILDILGRSFMLFFKPFGDFLAVLLRPLAIILMKAAVKFLQWTRKTGVLEKAREGMEKAPQIPKTGIGLIDFTIDIANWALQIGGAIGQLAYDIGAAAFGLGEKIGQWLYDEVIKPAGDYISNKILGLWDWTKDFGTWLWGKVTSIWNYTRDFGTWLWDEIKSIWDWTYDFGTWLWDKLTGAFSNLTDIFSNFGSWLWNKLKSSFGFGSDEESKGSYAVGTNFVPETGMYKLHRGEQVISQGKAGGSVVLSPTFNFTGPISQDIDVDSMIRRASRIAEMQLKSGGVI